MSQSLLVRASGHAGRLVSFIFPLKAGPPGLQIIFVALQRTPISFSITCLISLSLMLLRKIPCLSLSPQNKMMMVADRISAYRKQSRSLQPTGRLSTPRTLEPSGLFPLTLTCSERLLCSKDQGIYVETERVDLYLTGAAFLVVYLVNSH